MDSYDSNGGYKIAANLTKVGGNDVATGTGTSSVGTLRVVIATDQPSFSNPVPVSAASLPLPAGAATAAKQDTGNTSLASLDTNLGAQADAAASTDTGTFSLVSLFKRLLQRVTTLLGQMPSALTGSGNLKVAVVESTATVTVTGAGGTFPVTDSGGTLSVDDGGSTVSIDDGGASLTVDGTVSVTGNVDVTPAAPAGNDYLPVRLTDGSAFLSAVPVTDNGGSITVDAASLPLPTGAATETTLATLLSTSDFDTKAGALTETAPATDTASSGLNGRLQRLAQRLTSLIALLPSALTGSGNLKVAVVESTATVTVDSELPAAAALSDALANPTAPAVGSHGLKWDENGTQWVREVSIGTKTLLSSAARVATTDSAAQTNRGYRGVQVVLNVSAITTATLTLRILGTISPSNFYLTPAPTGVTATGAYVYELYPGAVSADVAGAGSPSVVQRIGGVLPPTWYVSVGFSGTTATYSVIASLLP